MTNVRKCGRTIMVTFLYILSFCDTSVSKWGEFCNSSEECSDHRYSCRVDDTDNKKKCFCDRFHEWKGNELGCVQMYNISTIMEILNVSHGSDSHMEKLHNATQRIFKGQVIAGYFVLSTVILSVVVVTIFCISTRKSDKKFKTELKRLKSRKRKSFSQQLNTYP